MGERSGCVVVILIMILVCNVVGIYFYIDSNSRYTVALAENSEKLDYFSNNLEKLEAEISSIEFRQPSSASSAQTKLDLTTQVSFANSEYRPPNATSGGTMTQAISGFSGNLNGLIRNESTTTMIESACNDGLAVRNLMRPDEFEPKLAQSWDISEDGLIYTIKIKKGVTWHPYTDPITDEKIEAKEVTTDDFIFYWDTINNLEVPCESIRTYFKLISNIEKIDKYTFRVTWSEPYALANNMTLGLTPLPKHYYRPNPEWTDSEFAAQMITSKRNQFIVGCGPYYLDNWKKGQSLTLKLYENYYGPKPYIKNIVFKVMPEPNVRLVELKKGGIDLLGLTGEQWIKETTGEEFKTVTPSITTAIEDSASWNELKVAGKTPKDYTFEKFQYEVAAVSWYYIAYNLKLPIFQDKNVRTALTMLTDRDRILEEVMHGFGKKIAGPFVGASPYVDTSVEPIPYDPEVARKLLKESGWEDTDSDGILDKDLSGDGKREPFKFSLMIPSSSVNSRKFGAIIQADLKKVGIEMDLAPIEWSVFIDKIDNKAFQSCSLGWTGVLNPDPYQIWHSSQADKMQSSNFIGFKNARADELIETGRRMTNQVERTKAMHEFYRLLHDEQPYTFLFSNISLRAQNKRFNNNLVYKLGMDENLTWIPKMVE